MITKEAIDQGLELFPGEDVLTVWYADGTVAHTKITDADHQEKLNAMRQHGPIESWVASLPGRVKK